MSAMASGPTGTTTEVSTLGEALMAFDPAEAGPLRHVADYRKRVGGAHGGVLQGAENACRSRKPGSADSKPSGSASPGAAPGPRRSTPRADAATSSNTTPARTAWTF